ncbi:MAG: hypothetical protein V3W32_00850 [Gemmatimonadota bacterium]
MMLEAAQLIETDRDLRSSIISIGLPILLPDGRQMLRGPGIKVRPPPGEPLRDSRYASQGWVDLRAVSWVKWRERCAAFVFRVEDKGGSREKVKCWTRPERGMRPWM